MLAQEASANFEVVLGSQYAHAVFWVVSTVHVDTCGHCRGSALVSTQHWSWKPADGQSRPGMQHVTPHPNILA